MIDAETHEVSLVIKSVTIGSIGNEMLACEMLPHSSCQNSKCDIFYYVFTLVAFTFQSNSCLIYIVCEQNSSLFSYPIAASFVYLFF